MGGSGQAAINSQASPWRNARGGPGSGDDAQSLIQHHRPKARQPGKPRSGLSGTS
jgi:hypothetical protein